MVKDHHPGCLVSTEWLAAHLSDPDLRIFECTTYLRPAEPAAGVPYHPEPGRADYEQGHIPGAGFLDLAGELSRQDAPVHFMMLPAEEFAAVMSRHGVGDGCHVVLYSRDRIMWATRVWWMLHVMGFDDAAVLDGGFEKWQAERRPVGTAPAAGADGRQAGRRESARRPWQAPDQYPQRSRLRRRGAVALRPPGPHSGQRQPALAGPDRAR
jgi:thiosulfate/3-mercaptopyruvate sulfurtransferase